MTRPSRPVIRALAAAVASMGAVGLLATAAYAESPVRVGWWNMVAAGGVAAPAPATPSGGIHVAAAPGQVLAYGAVLYSVPAHASLGTLTLSIAGSQGTVQLLACPTKVTSWSSGDDQSGDGAPSYDCSAKHASGVVAADGKSVAFPLTALAAGSLSLAIVPDTSGGGSAVNQPFSVDFDKPGASSLNVVVGTSAPAAPPATKPTTPAAAPAAPNRPMITAGRPLALPKLPPSATTQQGVGPATNTAPQLAPNGAPAPTASRPVSVSSRSSTAGSIVGALALIAALMFWGLGRGLLGGRIMPLSTPGRSGES